jgi:hypothetical protein
MVDENNKSDAQGRVHLDTNEARAGSTPGMTRYILAFSLVLIVVVFFAIWLLV